MQLMLLGGDVARLEKDGREPISLHVDWMDDNTLRIDWTPANKNWGSSVVRLGHVSGVPGLIEDEAKFWNFAFSLVLIAAAHAYIPSEPSDKHVFLLYKFQLPDFSVLPGRLA